MSGLTSASFAQTTLPLTGKVTNERNEAIQGVSVFIKGTQIGTSTNMEGFYTISLEAGKRYEIEFSAMGFATKLIDDAEVGASMENTLNVMLEFMVEALDEVVVKASSRRQEHTSALLNFQKNNVAVSSGIAADFIRRTPDKNTGEVLKRVSGTSIQDNKFVVIRGLSDRYNAAYINGAQLPSSEPDKKAFSFDVIPSQLIDNIIINKTATPDLTGEFAGGLVQVVTKDIPNRNQLSMGVSLGFNLQSVFSDFYNNPRGRYEWLGFSDRGLPEAFPAKSLEYNKLPLAEKIAASQMLHDDVYRQVQSTAIPTQQFNLTWSNVLRSKNGGSFGSVVGIIYRQARTVNAGENAAMRFLPDYFDYLDDQYKYQTNLGAVANFAWSKGNHKIAFKNLFNQLLDDNYYNRSGESLDNLQHVRLYSSVLNQRSLYTTQLEGTHGLFKSVKLNWNLNYAFNSKQMPDLRVQTFTQSQGAEDYTLNTRGNNSNRFFSDLQDNAFGYSASLVVPFTLGGNSQTMKVGGAGTAKIRNFGATILGYNDPLNASLLALSYDRIFRAENFKEDGFYYSTALQNPSDKYFGLSTLNAAYLMFDNKVSNKIRVVWGMRAEFFQQFLKSNSQRLGDTALLIFNEKIDLLPSLNLTFSPTARNNFRISGSRTVARPEFREIAPFGFFDFEQLASIAGNEQLMRSSILNADMRYEYYPRAGEVFSIGAFYKHFTDPIELRLDEGSGGSRRQYQFRNAEKAELTGLELEFRKSLGFLSESSDFLNSLYLNGNGTWIVSEVTLDNIAAGGNKLESSTRPLQGQSPYLINAGLQYDNSAKGFGFSLLYNRIGQRLSLVGNQTFPDIYENSRDLVDLQFSKKLMKSKAELKLTVSDLLNQQIMLYQNIDSRSGYTKGTDIPFSSFTSGTTISVGFIYDFNY